MIARGRTPGTLTLLTTCKKSTALDSEDFVLVESLSTPIAESLDRKIRQRE